MVPREVTMEGCNPRMNNLVNVVAFNSQIPRYSRDTQETPQRWLGWFVSRNGTYEPALPAAGVFFLFILSHREQ